MGKYAITRAANNQRRKSGNAFNEVGNYFPTASDFDSEYEYDLYMAQYPLIGRIYQSRANRLSYEESKRYNKDRAKHMGYDLAANPYPIRSGYYSTPYNETFEVTEAIMSLYGMKGMIKW